MAQLDLDPSTSLSTRLRRFADALEEEGRPGAAGAVRVALVEYRERLAAGDSIGALVVVSGLGTLAGLDPSAPTRQASAPPRSRRAPMMADSRL